MQNNFRLVLKLTERSMIAIISRTDDHKLLQESSLTARQPRRVSSRYMPTCAGK